MSSREANVKVTIKTGAAVAGLKTLERETRSTGGRMAAALSSSMKAGLGAAKSTIRDMVGNAVSTLKTAATLGGAFSVAKFVKDAVSMRAVLRDLEFQVNKTGTQAIRWQDLQAEIHRVTDKTATGQTELAEAFKTVFSATGDSKFALASLDAIGTTSAATGDNVAELANVAQLLQRKFGATAETLPEMMARFVEKTGVGGPALEGLGNKFALMAGEAQEAGFKGEEGLSMLLGTMVRLDSRVGEKAEPGLKRLFQTLKKGSADLKTLQKEGGFKFKGDEDFIQKIEKMLSGKGRKAIEAKLSGESRTVFDELVKPFDEAFKQATIEGKKAKEATAIATEAFRKSMQEAGKSTLKFETLVENANQELKEEPEAKFKLAVEKMARAFEKPEMMRAVDSLSENLPKLAETITKLIDFVVKNPKTAAAGFVGGKIGLSFAGAALRDLGSGMGRSASDEMKKNADGVGRDIGRAAASGMRPGGGRGGMMPTVATAAAVGAGALAVDQFSKLEKEAGLETKLVDAIPGFEKGKFDSDKLLETLMATVTLGAVGGGEKTVGAKLGLALGRTGAEVATREDRANAAAKVRRMTEDLNKQFAAATAPAEKPGVDASEAAKEMQTGGKAVKEGGDKLSAAADKLSTAAARLSSMGAVPGAPGGPTKGPMPVGPVTPGAAPRPG